MERKEYIKAELPYTEQSPEDLLGGTYLEEIVSRMKTVVETEAPVRRSILYKRVIYSFGMQKIGSRLITIFDSAASSLDYVTTEDEDGETVFHFGPEEFFRPTPDSDLRYSYQIPYKEAANCLRFILENGEKNSYSKSELYRLFLTEMGYQKSGASLEDLFEGALKYPTIKRSGNGRILK
ncbi:MAG: DUF3320 domain-containing protein [Spirochaetales bacterium]|nr:DUF3320 domain-containing protein [Candidatus Physcosoma equi]